SGSRVMPSGRIVEAATRWGLRGITRRRVRSVTRVSVCFVRVSSGVDRWGSGPGPAGAVREGDGVGEQDARVDGADPRDEPDARGERDRGGGSGQVPHTVVPMADVMAEMPGVWRRLLAAHVADRLGRCRGCRSDTGSGERWPCSLHRIATEAQRLHDQKLARAVDTD
ncbi:MAG: hypothetical protein QOK35_831, partial [Pseudonocardiales bacterium]|nr:hypothetical protein [Pseudonocardiales bacterium]